MDEKITQMLNDSAKAVSMNDYSHYKIGELNLAINDEFKRLNDELNSLVKAIGEKGFYTDDELSSVCKKFAHVASIHAGAKLLYMVFRPEEVQPPFNRFVESFQTVFEQYFKVAGFLYDLKKQEVE